MPVGFWLWFSFRKTGYMSNIVRVRVDVFPFLSVESVYFPRPNNQLITHVMIVLPVVLRRLFLRVQFVFCIILFSIPYNSLALDYGDFVVLPESEQRQLIAKGFATWLDATRNMRYTATETLTAYKKNRESQSVILTLKTTYNHWLKDDAYRMATQITDPTGSSAVVQDYQHAFNKQRGERRGTTRVSFEDGTTKMFGRIDTVQHNSIVLNPFWAWLSDNFADSETRTYLSDEGYLFSFSLKRQDSWKIVLLPEEQRVKLIVPFEKEFDVGTKTRQVGKKTFTIDVQKGFLPILVDVYWEELPKSSNSMYRMERYTVEESVKFGLAWMPTKLKYELLEASQIPNQVHVYTLQLVNVEFGTVKQSDVEIVFPEGTEVVDAINGITYKTDVRGSPIESTVEELYDLDPSQPQLPQPEKKRTVNYVLIVIGIIMIIMALYMMYRKRRNAS
jgi:hypothetical protein